MIIILLYIQIEFIYNLIEFFYNQKNINYDLIQL